VHFSDPSPLVLTAMIRTHFKGTNVALVPSGTRGTLRIVDPYGRQMPWYRVQRGNGRYFFIEQRSEK